MDNEVNNLSGKMSADTKPAHVNAQYDDNFEKQHLFRRCTAISELIDKL